MPKTNFPNVRNDRITLEEWEDYIILQTLYDTGNLINALTAAGAIYGRTPLPPEFAEQKRLLMEQGGQ